MYPEVEDELERLKQMLTEDKMENNKSNNFLDISDYEDDYSHKEISIFHSQFLKEAEKYLKEHYNGQYAIYGDWCIHVVTMEFYNQKIEPYSKVGIIC